MKKKSISFNIGNCKIGGFLPPLLQSMTNTPTRNVAATVSQCQRLAESGSEMIRITVPTMEDISFLRDIKKQFRKTGFNTPLIADVHYFPEVAEEAATIVNKVRINPGNFTDKHQNNHTEYSDLQYKEAIERMAERAFPLIQICQREGTAIRIGVNQGSLCDRIINRYGHSEMALAMSAMEWIDICDNFGFKNVVLSLKSSNVNTMISANLKLTELMSKYPLRFPLHLGVTEAANGMSGRIKSAVGIGTLLLNGFGDTLRVSLTEKPENEIIFAKKLVEEVNKISELEHHFISDHESGDTLVINSFEKDPERLWASCAALAGFYHQKKMFDNIIINNPNFSIREIQQVCEMILQACRIKMSQTEIIACPSCGRTQYNIEEVLTEVRKRFSDYPNLKIGVMGCVVNGPGEMADADFGVIGSATGHIAVYKEGKRISNFLPSEEALTILEQAILAQVQK